MSVYEYYFSVKNKNYIYGLLKDLLLKDFNLNIDLDFKYRNIYDKNYAKIFKESTSESLQEINKENINIIGQLILNESKKYSGKLEKETDKQIFEKTVQKEEYIDEILYSNNRDITSSNTNMLFNHKYNNVIIQKIIIPDSVNSTNMNLYLYLLINDNYVMLELDGKVELDNILYYSYKPCEYKIINIDKSPLKIMVKDNHKNQFKCTKDIIIPQEFKSIILNELTFLCFKIENLSDYDIHENEMIGLCKKSDQKIIIIYKCKIHKITKDYLLLNIPKDFDSKLSYNLIIMKEQLMIRIKYL